MDNRLKKIIELIKKTGDRFIVWETDSNEPYVVMSLVDYEKLVEVKFPAPAPKAAEAQLLKQLVKDSTIWESKQKKDEGLARIDFAAEQKIEPSAAPVEPLSGAQPSVLEDAAVTVGENKEDDEEEYFFEPVE